LSEFAQPPSVLNAESDPESEDTSDISTVEDPDCIDAPSEAECASGNSDVH